MKKFVRQYENPNVARFNNDLIEKNYDEPLVDYIIDCCKSLEALKYIKFVGYKYITNADEIDISSYITAKSRNKPTSKKDKELKYMHLKDSRFAELRMKFHLSCKGEECEINKKVLIPVPDKQGRYLIYGTEYFMMYQQVDNSTYTTKSSLVLKSMMPVVMKPDRETMKCTTGEEFTAPVYTINIFKNDTDIMLFYFAKIGVQKTLEYYSVDRIMRFVNKVEDTDANLYFSVSSKLYLEVNKHFFEKYQYVRTVAFMVLRPMTNRMTTDVLENKGMWIESIGSIRNSNKNTQYEKGANTLLFFDRLLDDTTKRVLKLHPIHDKNIYSVVRWMIMNFNDLRKKDNLNLDNKRLRCNEYIASLISRAFNERVTYSNLPLNFLIAGISRS